MIIDEVEPVGYLTFTKFIQFKNFQVTKRYTGTISESYVECTTINQNFEFNPNREWIRPAFDVDGKNPILQ